MHGPLTMTLKLDLFRREMPDAWIESFDLRVVAPVYDTMDFSVHGAPGDEPGRCRLWAMSDLLRDPAGRPIPAGLRLLAKPANERPERSGGERPGRR